MGHRPDPHVGRSWLRRVRAGAIALSLALPGCTGIFGDPPGAGVGEGAQAAERSRFPRLSHAQWENTIRDLFRLDALPGLSASFTGDPLGGVFDNNEVVLMVTPGLWADYQVAAEELSLMITGTPALLARIVPEGAPVDPAAFIQDFGLRAYRRPLTPAEVDAYRALFDGAGAILTDTDPTMAGLQMTLQAFLQSPHFVYRAELGEAVRADGLIPLSGYEIATKLSYLLWNTMPDDALLAAAGAGELGTPEGVRAYAERMLDDPRARDTVAAFHRQLFDYEKYHDLYKDPAVFPEFVPEMGDDMQREAELFVDHIVFNVGGGLTDLLTARTTFVNDRLAAVYGLEGQASADFQEMELDPAQRSGILTRLGFLAANGTAFQPDSIHRGVFINLRILCADLPPPPDNATGLPPSASGTNRERVDAHTGEGTCGASCHGTLINPMGFAFEHYDAIGQFRTTDNGFPVNAADQYTLGGETRTFNDAIELSQILAESAEAHRCYTEHWLEFAYGRASRKEDGALLDKLGEESRGGASVRELILRLIESDAFTTRAPVEAP